jgi:hypothetical protein
MVSGFSPTFEAGYNPAHATPLTTRKQERGERPPRLRLAVTPHDWQDPVSEFGFIIVIALRFRMARLEADFPIKKLVISD